jgi:mitochondrial fission protein ELM1
VLATTSRRTGEAATRALRGALASTPGELFAPADDGENPFLGYLAWADRFVITGDSESMLAEATSLGRPVAIFPLPERPSFRVLRFFREWVLRRATAEPAGPRGSGRPQRGLERLCGRLIENGFVRPARDLERLHDDLIARGVAYRLGEAGDACGPPLREADVVAERVRRLMGMG